MSGIFDGAIRGELMVDLLLVAICLGAWLGGGRWRR